MIVIPGINRGHMKSFATQSKSILTRVLNDGCVGSSVSSWARKIKYQVFSTWERGAHRRLIAGLNTGEFGQWQRASNRGAEGFPRKSLSERFSASALTTRSRAMTNG